MDQKLENVRQHLATVRRALPQTTTSDEPLYEALQGLLAAVDWLSSAVEHLAEAQP